MSRDTLEQEPCEMTAEEYRQRMIQAFHNADTDELIAICVLPTEREFEHLEWLLKNHYKKEPCGDAVDRKLVCAFIAGLISDDGEREKGLEYIRNMSAVNPQLCEDAISRAEAVRVASGYCHPANVAKELAKLPAVNPQPKTGRWVPVGERLPKENEEVLVTTVWGKVAIGERYSTLDYFINDGEINANEDEIVAWMPLPKRYDPQERSDKG